MADYYFDATLGNDSTGDGSESTPWQTIAKANNTTFSAGDTANFKRGETWSGTELGCDNAGTDADNMVTYQDYSSGALPIIENTGTSNERCCRITADWVKLKNLHFNDGHFAGVEFASGADRNIVEGCEMSAVGSGVVFRGEYNLVDDCYIHDLTMIVNDPTPNNDYGAVGATFYNGSSYSEVRYCTFYRCRAAATDYAYDGGVIEFFLSGTVTGVKFHHNWSEECNGFLETGGAGGSGLVQNLEIYHNIGSENYGENSFSFHTSGGFAVDHDNIQVYNNTFIDIRDYVSPKYSFISFGSGTVASDFLFRNNIFYVDDWSFICHSGAQGWNWTHEYNCYYRGSPPTQLGFAMSTGEITQNPSFVNVSGEDYSLNSNSPCIDVGDDVGLTEDYIGEPIPYNSIPDIGAYEYAETALEINVELKRA